MREPTGLLLGCFFFNCRLPVGLAQCCCSVAAVPGGACRQLYMICQDQVRAHDLHRTRVHNIVYSTARRHPCLLVLSSQCGRHASYILIVHIDLINIIILMIIITITMRRPPVLCYPFSLGDLLDWARRLASATITVCVPLARQMTTKTTRR